MDENQLSFALCLSYHLQDREDSTFLPLKEDNISEDVFLALFPGTRDFALTAGALLFLSGLAC